MLIRKYLPYHKVVCHYVDESTFDDKIVEICTPDCDSIEYAVYEVYCDSPITHISAIRYAKYCLIKMCLESQTVYVNE